MKKLKENNDEIKVSEVGCPSWLQRTVWATWSLLTAAMFAYASLSALIIYSTSVKMEFVFSHRVRTPWFANLSACSDFGLTKCQNIQLDGNAGKIGAWFVSPPSQQDITDQAYILYLHGNMGTRALAHRIELYKKLSKMGYHILAIDYRGFGDSDGHPTEHGLVEDSKSAYKWLHKKAGGHAVYVWGHSLGSAVGIQLASWLNAARMRLNGVVLEAPFNNLTDAIVQTPLAVPLVQFLPNLVEYLEDVKNVFRTTFWIQKVSSPILIFHDVSDTIINIKLGRRLYLTAKDVGTSNVRMVEFDEQLNHCYLYKARNLIPLLRDFVSKTS